MDKKFAVARAPFMPGSNQVPDEGIALQNPYNQDDSAIIREADDFTVSVTTISASLFSEYQDFYKANVPQYRNDYFVLTSNAGLGTSRSAEKVHEIKLHTEMKSDIENLKDENVIVVEDYNANQHKEMLSIDFHAFCQGLGNTSGTDLQTAIIQVGTFVGTKLLGLVPFVEATKIVAEGVNNLFSKCSNHGDEVKTARFNLYPATEKEAPAFGDAPLQTGAYVIFFESMDITGLRLDSRGVVLSASGAKINPYVVVNIKNGVILLPDQQNTSAALEVLERFNAGPGEFAAKGEKPPEQYFAALNELGKSYRLVQQSQRYFELKQKGDTRTPEESTKFVEITKILKEHFPDWDAETV
jgi:hypothetical protein